MKLRTFSLIVVLSCGACTTAPTSDLCAGHIVVPASSVYVVSAGDISRCEQLLARRLSRSGRKLRDYCLRFTSEIRDGTPYISGIAGMKGRGGESYLTNPASEVVPLQVFGGGEAFFHFEYDCVRKKLTAFDFNAPL